MSRWVKVSVIVGLLVVVLVIVVMLIGSDGHGPRRHTGSVASEGVSAWVRR